MRFLLLLPALVAAKCPLNWLQYGDLCYFYSPMTVSWQAAEQICQTRGGHLASIHSQAQNDFIINSVIQRQEVPNDTLYYTIAAYLGGYYDYATRKWKWTDDSPMDYNNYRNGTAPDTPFLGTHPQSIRMFTGEDVQTRGTWFYLQNYYATYAQSFVCQAPPCDANGVSAPSLLAPITTNTALFYMASSNSWFYGCPNCLGKIYLPQEGELLCQSIGGHLPSVVNAFQNTDLYNGMQKMCKQVNSLMQFQTFLFGLTSDASGSNWTFNDGTPVVFTNWGGSEPRNYNHTAYSFVDAFTGVWYSDDNHRGWNGHDLGCQIKVDINLCQ